MMREKENHAVPKQPQSKGLGLLRRPDDAGEAALGPPQTKQRGETAVQLSCLKELQVACPALSEEGARRRGDIFVTIHSQVSHQVGVGRMQ